MDGLFQELCLYFEVPGYQVRIMKNCGLCSPRCSKHVALVFLDMPSIPGSKPDIGEGDGSYAAHHMPKTGARLTHAYFHKTMIQRQAKKHNHMVHAGLFVRSIFNFQ